MSPVSLIEHSLTHSLDFKGRAGRSEYWYWILFSIAMAIGFHFIGLTVTAIDWLAKIWALFALIVSISLTVRRLHDLDLSGKWYLLVPGAALITFGFASVAPEAAAHLLFVPVVLVMIFYFLVGFGPGEDGDNRFGGRFPAPSSPDT